MKSIFYIFALSMFLSCQEETSSGFRICDGMTFSDALPVQFWLVDCETYNEYEANGVHHVCWCAPWLCTDEIITQFQDTTGQTLSLLAKNAEGEYLYEAVISEIQSGVYQASIIPDDEGICDETIQFLIGDTDSVVRLIAPSSWTNDVSTFDVKGATSFQEALDNTDTSISAYQALSAPSGTIIGFTFDINQSGGPFVASGSQRVRVQFYAADGSGTAVSNIHTETITEYVFGSPNPIISTASLTLTGTAERLYVRIISNLTSQSMTVNIEIPVGQILYISNADISAKSDCLNIATTQDETILIEYSNQRNFAGLIYENDSPDTTFNVRVPCRFFHETEPEEDEAMELTSSVLTTMAQVKTQRLLEVKHVPYYFHKKLRRVLKHQTITIGSIEWKKEEQYQVNEGRKNWPLKSATCLLTEKNSVVRNVL